MWWKGNSAQGDRAAFSTMPAPVLLNPAEEVLLRDAIAHLTNKPMAPHVLAPLASSNSIESTLDCDSTREDTQVRCASHRKCGADAPQCIALLMSTTTLLCGRRMYPCFPLRRPFWIQDCVRRSSPRLRMRRCMSYSRWGSITPRCRGCACRAGLCEGQPMHTCPCTGMSPCIPYHDGLTHDYTHGLMTPRMA